MSQLHIVAFAGSTRKDSYNKVLIRLAAEMAEKAIMKHVTAVTEYPREGNLYLAEVELSSFTR